MEPHTLKLLYFSGFARKINHRQEGLESKNLESAIPTYANHLWGHIRIAREIFRQQLLQCPPNLSASVSLDELLQGWNISPNPKTPHALATVYSNFSGGLLQYDVFCLIVGSMIFFLETHLVFFGGVVLFRHSIFAPVSS